MNNRSKYLRWPGVFGYVNARPLGHDSLRRNLKALKSVVMHTPNNFRRTWGASSSNDIVYCGHLYFEKYTLCYDTQHNLRFRLEIPTANIPQRGGTGRRNSSTIIATLSYEIAPAHPIQNKLIALTESGHVLFYNLYTGKLLQTILPAPPTACKYRSITWETHYETFALITSCKRGRPFSVALFGIDPLRLIAHFQCPPELFGAVTHAEVYNQVLFTMHTGNIVRMYSLPDILERFLIDDPTVHAARHPSFLLGDVCGLPYTHQLTSLPQLLMQLESSNHHIDFGGEPLTYIYRPPTKTSSTREYVLRNLLTHEKIEGPSLEDNNCWEVAADDTDANPNSVHFYDNDWRLLHHRPDCVTAYVLERIPRPPEKATSDAFERVRWPRKLSKYYEITSANPQRPRQFENGMAAEDDVSAADNYYLLSSGRIVKKQGFLKTAQTSIHSAHFEDEFDILVVALDGTVFFYDNAAQGKYVGSVTLARGRWREEVENTIILDRDVLIHLAADISRKLHWVDIYEWQRRE